MRRLAGGLVSWLTYQQVALRSEMYSERFVYTPIFELASARGWRADHEFSVKLDSEEITRRLDFVFSFGSRKHDKNDKVVALEIKYISQNEKQKTKEIQKIMIDEEKLKKFDDGKFHKGIHAPIDRYIMLMAKKKSLESLCSQARKNGKSVFGKGSLMKRVQTIINNGKHYEAEPFGEIFYSPFNYKALWCVVILFVPGK
jgi:hypothetical protein